MRPLSAQVCCDLQKLGVGRWPLGKSQPGIPDLGLCPPKLEGIHGWVQSAMLHHSCPESIHK